MRDDETRTCPVAAAIPKALFNGIPFGLFGPADLTAVLGAMLDCDHRHVVHFLAADPTTIARRDETYGALLRRAELNISDGLPIVWTLRAMGAPARRLTAFDGLTLVCEWGLSRGLEHYFFGSSEPVLERLRANLESRYPGLRIAGMHSPPYRPLQPSELKDAAEAVRAAGADVLWVGLGAPKQGYVAEQLRAHEAAPVIITIGAAFDFAAGTKRRAPQWMRSLGLEWLFRAVQEPRRLGRRYVVGNTRFIEDAAREIIRARMTGNGR